MSSESSQEQTQANQDRRIVAGQGAVTATEGSSLIYQALDNGAIQRSFDSADKSLAGAFGFGRDTVEGALSFGRTAIAQSMDSSRDALEGSLSFGSKAINAVQGTFSDALSYSKQTTAAALDNLQATQKLTADAYNDAKGRGAMTDKLLMGAVAAMAVVAAVAVRNR